MIAFARKYSLPSALLFAVVVLIPTTHIAAQEPVTSPLEEFGFNIGDDYNLANYTQFEAYWRKLAAESPRMVLQEIGPTAEGRTQLMAIITSPENHANLRRYQDISRRLAQAEGLTDEEARSLANEGRAVVWIDGGLHATEVLGAHQLIETVYQLVNQTDEETLRFLNDAIVLAVHANPDGMELVSNWYMREAVPENRSTSGIPRLYQKYIGHDNNRDFFMASQPETENMTRIMFREWFPQIVYNHHQTGPAGTVMFAPPFRDPFNYNLDPLIPLGIEMVGAAMHSRFVAEGKPGTTMRSGASYSTWWNGGLRTTVYFHNMIGLLTETIGNPTPMEIPLVSGRQLPRNDLPAPIQPQVWHFRQSIDYSVTANRAVLDYASRYRETLLYHIYLMGRNSIERGSRDNWTIHPARIEALNAAAREAAQGEAQARRFRGIPAEYYDEVLRDPAARDARGYIIRSDQDDFPTATKFVNTLIKNGVVVEQATSEFQVAGKSYPDGSYIVRTAQAFRPHVVDMFEPQDHPNDFAYPGGPPIPPYDNAGWTLAFQMGVRFDRILDGFDGPFQKIEGYAVPLTGLVSNARGAAGFMLSHTVNDGFIATNRLMGSGEEVYWLSEPVQANGKTYPVGTVYVPSGANTLTHLQQMARELGLTFDGVPSAPSSTALKIRPVRIGLWDRYGGSMPSGWTRWILEQFEFQYELAFPSNLNEGRLSDRYDVLVFVGGAIPRSDPRAGQQFGGFGSGERDPATIPAEYRRRLGRVSVDTTVPRLNEFLLEGGTIITIGSSTVMAEHSNLPVGNHLVGDDGRPLSNDEYFVPGSILEVAVDNTVPVAWGLDEHIYVSFNRSPVFRLEADAAAQGLKSVAWFDTDEPLRSGWAWGQEYLKDGVAIVDAKVGRGSLYLFGPEIVQRGQPHGTYKLLFNGIYLAGAEEVKLGEATGR